MVVGGGAAGARLLAGPTPAGPVGAARRRTGRIVERQLRAQPATVDLGGRTVSTWAFDGTVPGPQIRVSAGDELRVRLTNALPDPTTVHWHGVAVRNDMDGVPGVTQPAVAPGRAFEYSFVVAEPGTYWYHPHVGVQLDRGLQGPLIVEDPHEAGRYDQEEVLVLDDWTDGLGASPRDLLARMRRDGMSGGSGMAGMSGDSGMAGMSGGSGMSGGGMGGPAIGGMGAMSPVTARQPLGPDTGDVAYPAHLINGRLPTAPVTLTSAPGRRIRLRLINAGGDTAYRFAVGGHRLTVTHADGFPVRPVQVDTLILGMGERYDVLLTAGDGAFPIVAVPEGKRDPAGVAVLRTAAGPTPSPRARPAELAGRMLTYRDLTPLERVALTARTPDLSHDVVLTMRDGGRRWLINDRPYDQRLPLPVRQGQRLRLVLRNRSMMFHPMHLHGHTFALADRPGAGPRKDTVNVLPMQTLAVDLQADNPGQWLIHCHNTYHAELGMMTVLSYRAGPGQAGPG